MRRVGIITNLMTGYGGVQTCVISLIKGLNRQGIIPDIIADQNPKSLLWEEQGLKANIQIVNYSISLSTFKKYRKILQPIWEFVFYLKTSWIKKDYDFLYIFQPNVVVDSDHNHLFYLSMSPRAKGFTKTPWLSKFKDIVYKYLIKWWHPIFEFQNYNCVINSNYTASYFEEYFKKKIDVIYPSNLIKEEEYSVAPVKMKKTVLFLSRIAEYKRPDLMLKLAKTYPDFTFYIVGGLSPANNAYYDQLLNTIKVENLRNVEVHTNLPHAQMVEFVRRSEYYFFGARNEHFGITTVEAMLFGAIPFVHNSGGQREVVPFDNLRFDDDNLLSKFEMIVNWTESDLERHRSAVSLHARNFTEDVYITKMVTYINN
jgi:glycosyltransferase involved in cell wall biosynthesis